MKKSILFFVFSFLCMTAIYANSPAYIINDAEIDQLMNQAEEVSLLALNTQNGFQTGLQQPTKVNGDDEIIAFALCWVLGEFGVHRWYMGSSVGTYILYFITLGGCGIVYVIDWIMLLISAIDDEKDISKYLNNPKFLMWTD